MEIEFYNPLSIAEQFLTLNAERVICTLYNQMKIYVALMPKGKNSGFFNVNKETKKALNILEGFMVEEEIETNRSKYGIQAHEEILELLRQDIEGSNWKDSF
jgi:CRISPR/Cas system CSM-associated protein Csm5 (group 7 of RAMP superfamily)